MHRIDVLSEIEELGRCLLQASTETPVTELEHRPQPAMAGAIAHCIAQWYLVHDRLNALEDQVAQVEAKLEAELRRAA
jgi:hypothetical protein